ncbi:MAG: NUDIX domain-containing protein [archaeon]
MSDELVDLLDNKGNKTGKMALKSEAHKKGLWHEAVHLWIFNDKGEILLQHRCPEKVLFPNLWDISVAGHMGAGEDPGNVALREAKEELGLNLNRSLLKKISVFKLSVEANDSILNNEFIHLFTYKLNYKPKLVYQKGEVDDAKFISLSDFESDLTDKKRAKQYVADGKFYGEALNAIRQELSKIVPKE